MKKFLFIILLAGIIYPKGEIKLSVKYKGKPIKASVFMEYIDNQGKRTNW